MTYTPQHHSTDSDASARPIVDGPVTGVAHHTVARALPAIALPAAPFAPEPIARPAAGSLAAFSRDVERRSTQRQDRRSRDRGSDRRQYASQVMASPLYGPEHDPRPQIRPTEVPAAPVGPIDLRMPTLPEIHHVDAHALGLSMQLDAPTAAPATSPAAIQPALEPRVARMHFAIPPAPAAPVATATGVPIRRPATPAMPVRGINGERIVLDAPPAPDAAPEPPTSSLSPYPAAVQQQLVQPATWIPAEPAATTPSTITTPTDDVALIWNSAGNALPDLTAEFLDAGAADRLGFAAGVGPRRTNWLLRLMLLITVPGTVGAGLAYLLNELVVSRL